MLNMVSTILRQTINGESIVFARYAEYGIYYTLSNVSSPTYVFARYAEYGIYYTLLYKDNREQRLLDMLNMVSTILR